MNFSNSERVDMVVLYSVADGNARLARESYIERFPNRAIPYTWTFTSVVQHLQDHGTFKPQTHDRGRDRTERILQVEEQILERVEEKPHISTRRFAAEVGVSQFVVHRMMDEVGFTRKTVFNSHNTHNWSDENPLARQEDLMFYQTDYTRHSTSSF